MPRILIADDDPVSLRFLHAALAASYDVVAVADGAATLAAAHQSAFDLLLLDRRMPDIGGAELLTELRKRGVAAAAIATSAEIDAAISAQLRAAGFADIVEKPVTVERLLQIIGKYLHVSASPPAIADISATPVLLNDQSALAAVGGDVESLRALRGLLAQELATLETELQDGDPLTRLERLSERLHRLRASCGFCGATVLAAAAQRLERALRADTTAAQGALAEFTHACCDTATALRS